MDYKAFFSDIADWIYKVNDVATKHGMHSDEFWKWVVDSIADIGTKYGNNKLVVKQMSMMYLWLEEVYLEGVGQKADDRKRT